VPSLIGMDQEGVNYLETKGGGGLWRSSKLIPSRNNEGVWGGGGNKKRDSCGSMAYSAEPKEGTRSKRGGQPRNWTWASKGNSV